jgi:hypothetical protein
MRILTYIEIFTYYLFFKYLFFKESFINNSALYKVILIILFCFLTLLPFLLRSYHERTKTKLFIEIMSLFLLIWHMWLNVKNNYYNLIVDLVLFIFVSIKIYYYAYSKESSIHRK